MAIGTWLICLDMGQHACHCRMSILLVVFLQCTVGARDGLKEADKVQSLLGQPTAGAPFDQYSGYVTVDTTAGRALFYYFVESAQNSSSKPLVLWLSGGPGCFSLGNGAMMEVGPFKVNSGKCAFP